METVEDAIKEIFLWQYQSTGSFYNLLITLFRVADYENRVKLSRIWPNLAIALTLWEAAGASMESHLFKGLGIKDGSN